MSAVLSHIIFTLNPYVVVEELWTGERYTSQQLIFAIVLLQNVPFKPLKCNNIKQENGAQFQCPHCTN